MKSYGERRNEAKQALQASREALDAVERRLNRYWEAIVQDRGHQTYLRLEQERWLRLLREETLEEAAEVARHLQDAIAAWWFDQTIKWPRDPEPDLPGHAA